MLASVVGLLNLALAVLRPAVFLAGALTAIVAAGSYAVRTRRLSPFSPIARFLRTSVDPWLIAPMERRIVRAGGTPAAAPWWTLAAVVIGGLLLLSAIEFVRDQLTQMVFASVTGSLLGLIIRWTFGVLQLALFAPRGGQLGGRLAVFPLVALGFSAHGAHPRAIAADRPPLRHARRDRADRLFRPAIP